MLDRLNNFFESEYRPLMANDQNKLTYTHLNIVLDYTAIEVVTMHENNVKANFAS